MTAEVAILNKSAVALAADSAVTIRTESREEKIFNTADKLFELSDHDPIGIMIYNGMSFMEAPLQVLIKDFRQSVKSVDHVEIIAAAFLKYLDEFGKDCRSEIKDHNVNRIVNPIVRKMGEEVTYGLRETLYNTTVEKDEISEAVLNLLESIVSKYENAFKQARPANFVGEIPLVMTRSVGKKIDAIVSAELPFLNDDQAKRVGGFLRIALTGDIMSPGVTGIVIAGFGKKDLFPTLVSYELDASIGGRIKYNETHRVDIDRLGFKARVLSFAQTEIADRFLLGIDKASETKIVRFCRNTLPTIREKVMERVKSLSEAEKSEMEEDLKRAEEAFLTGLSGKAISDIRDSSRLEVESMVEFMPKPELAQMAESLVELTSIKRRVSRGMETVGGPIDVAVISRSEGLVWVKRKHYFPPELNARYVERVRQRASVVTEDEDGTDEKSGVASPNGGGSAASAG